MNIDANWVYRYDKTQNTMTEALKILENIKPAPDRIVVIADEQTTGLGRNDNVWQSPRGGLWFTYCFKTEVISHQFTLFLGVILYRVLTTHFPVLRENLKIKWPNDLILDGKKLSGVLVQVKKGYFCVGVGMNTNNIEPVLDGFLQAVSLKSALGFEVSNNAIISSFLGLLHENLPIYESSGISTILSEINAHLYGIDDHISFDADSLVVDGICRGVNPEGALLIEMKNGEINPYFAGSIKGFGG